MPASEVSLPEGVSRLFKTCAENGKPEEKWIVFDGPIDAMWIESMNSVMDDNKLLTLINGDRIPLTPTMSLLFEVEDLAVASPATVSRAGMIYMDVAEMGWPPFVASWLMYVQQQQKTLHLVHHAHFDADRAAFVGSYHEYCLFFVLIAWYPFAASNAQSCFRELLNNFLSTNQGACGRRTPRRGRSTRASSRSSSRPS